MHNEFQNGDEVIIKGTITKSSGSSDDIYSKSDSKKKTFDVRDHLPEVTETVNTTQSVGSAIVSQASQMGMSGIVALGSGAYFQATAVTDNFIEAVETIEPMYAELVETGTITPPEGSKYQFVEIPKTESFFGKPVGDGIKSEEQIQAEKEMINASRPPDIGTEESGSQL